MKRHQDPPARVSGGLIGAAATPLTLFVSSRIDGLTEERAVVAQALRSFGKGLARAWVWESDGLGGRSAKDVCIAVAERCDLLVLVVADDISPIVRMEFLAAEAAGAECFVLAKHASVMTNRCRTFLRSLASRTILPIYFRNKSELRTHVINRIRNYILASSRAHRRLK